MRVLVVEDEREMREALKKCLEDDYFVVDTAEDGLRGSYLARVYDYDAIILDKLLPKKGGLEVCREVRANGRSMPIIMLSALSAVESRVELLDGGADDYITKPFSYRELRSRLRALLRRPRRTRETALCVDDLVLDAGALRAARGGRDLRLTKKEFSLLEFLMKNGGRIASRSEILERVWGNEVDPFSNTVEAHIRNLRKKLDSEDSPRLIHTIPGQGYWMEAPETREGAFADPLSDS